MNFAFFRCAFCNLEVRGWEKGDTAHSEHNKWNSNCPFLLSPKTIGNVPIGEEITKTSSDGIPNHSKINNYSVSFEKCKLLLLISFNTLIEKRSFQMELSFQMVQSSSGPFP
jgi:hypothetical protein